MNRVLLQEAIKLNRERKRKKRWQNAVRVMAAGVVFCTTYALILPAITMNRDPVCGVEAHEHGESCYVQQEERLMSCVQQAHVHGDECRDELGNLICGYGEQVIHSHDELCYDGSGGLVCLLPEVGRHIHSEECYAQSSELACTLPEEEPHVHGEECTETTDTLVCPLAEEEPYLHSEQCLETVSELACELPEDESHTHEEGCFRQISQLICQIPETEGHTHGEECHVTETATVCTLEETEGHIHGEECYQEITGLICQTAQIGEHTHTAECFDAEGSRICGIVQASQHQHDDSCFIPLETTEPVLACEMEVHVHEASCYPVEEATEETENPWLCDSGEHTHSESCLDEAGNLTCNIPEHTHEAACVVEDLDLNADVETREQWEAELNRLGYTGIWSQDVMTIAESQLGYRESTRNVILDENGLLRGYTRYGEWYGDRYGDWCAMYVSFCLHYAGVAEYPLESSCTRWIEMMKARELYREAKDHTPVPGDVIFFDWQQPGEAVEADHVGLVAELIPATEDTPARIRTIEGNSTEQVEYNTYDLADQRIIGYGLLPEQVFYCGMTPHYHAESCYDANGEAACGQQAHVHGEKCWDLSQNFEVNGRTLECGEEHEHTADCYGDAVAHFTYNDQAVSMKITVTSPVGIPSGTQIQVTGLSGESYDSYAVYAEENSVGALTGLTGYQFRFLLAGEEIEIEQAGITVELTVNGASDASGSQTGVFSTGGEGMRLNGTTVFGNGNGLLNTQDPPTEPTEEPPGTDPTGEPTEEPAEASAEEPTEVIPTEEPEQTLPAENQEPISGELETDDTSTIRILSQVDGAVTTQQTLEPGGSSKTTTISLGSGKSIALMSEAAARFTVEYYANYPLFQYSSSNPGGTYLEIIDTRGNGDGTGGSLPYNAGSITETGTARGKLYLKLRDTGRTNTDRVSSSVTATYGTAVYEVMTVDTLTRVYREAEHTYSAGMNIMNVDALHENTHYELSQMWVSSDGGDTWTVYTGESGNVTAEGYTISATVRVDDLHSVKFTNNPENTGHVLISDQDTVRMVYELVEGIQYVSANLFDYDITDTRVYVRNSSDKVLATYDSASGAIGYVNGNSGDDGKIYMRTVGSDGNNLGINALDSYVSTSGSAYLAFGNANTGMTYQSMKRSGAYINQANRANSNSTGGFKYCHFGLVTGYDILTDKLTYAAGVNHQALFNDEAYYMSQYPGYSVEGKTSYYRQRLDFTRTGDTYVLSAVNGGNALGNGVTAGNLDEFNYTAATSRNDLLSNNFWPMDGTSGDSVTGKDMEFGTYADYTNGFRRWYNAATGADANLPQSDDGLSHNSYFGMQFSVEFTMDGEYCGPLEYLFYGDDDMWVFLTDIETGDTRLICDIGGVHSSVGSFTDLWDYIPADSTGTYRLTFFYTERGASGSSCYMAFTLPQVTSITQNTPDTGSVAVTKKVEGQLQTTDEVFGFLFELSGSGEGVGDNFGYEIADAEGNEVSSGLISSGGTFSLKQSETITIVGIPEGLTYTITEQFTDGQKDSYNVSWAGTTSADGRSVSGEVVANRTHSYECINSTAGNLSLTKELNGSATEMMFAFNVTLSDSQGNPISGTFGAHTFTDGALTLNLKAGETITLTNLPTGAGWTVTEAVPEGFRAEYQVDGVTVESAQGTVAHNTTVTVKIVNHQLYTLPSTGGRGIVGLSFGGLLITAAALICLGLPRQRRRKGGV